MMKTNIVELDSYAANPGDLSWEEMETLEGCSFTRYDRTPAHLTVERAREADIVLTNKVVIDAEVMAELPRLKYIGVLATGYNVVDIDAARARGITVTNIPAYSTMSVAQMVFAHLLNVTQQVALYDAGRVGEKQGLLFLQSTPRGTGRQDDGHRRAGQHRECCGAHRAGFRYEGVGLHEQDADARRS